MAYSNWGAKVYINQNPCPERCDVPVYREPIAGYEQSGVVKFWTELIRIQEEKNNEWIDHPHHAVLGNGRVRLCGYKSSGELWIDKKLIKSNLGWDEDFEPTVYEDTLDLDGQVWKIYAASSFDPESVELKLVEPDGTMWEATSGYCLGEGHEEWY